MSPTRLSHDEQVALAQDELTRLGSLLDDLSVVVTGPEQVSFYPTEGAGWPAKVIAYDAVGEAVAKQLVATEARGQKVVVANRISGPARKYLTDQQWAWLDRRIGAHIPIGRRDIEVRFTGPNDSAGVSRGPGRTAEGPIRGRAGIAYAAALLCNPTDPPSFRSVAVAVDMTPTAISNAVKQLAEAGLVGPGNEPTLPDLFWALADVWQPLKVFPIASVPDPTDPALATRADRLDEPGWALGGDLAAAELGAPVFSAEPRPWLWVPKQVELRRVERTCGPATWEERAAVIAAPPTALVCQRRLPSRSGGSTWPLPRPCSPRSTWLTIQDEAARSWRNGHPKEPTLSGDSGSHPVVVLPAALDDLVQVLRALTAPNMPALAVIGGTPVNIRLSTAADAHRATRDIDLVANTTDPTAVQLLAERHTLLRENTVLVNGTEVDIIDTGEVAEDQLDELDNGSRLFVVGHRWALETADLILITTAQSGAPSVEIPVASAAGLVAAKSHAAGYPRSARRATKHGADLFDIYRLIEVFDTRGELRIELAAAPGHLGRLVASVVQTEILARPAQAIREMQSATPVRLDVDRITDVIEPFVTILT